MSKVILREAETTKSYPARARAPEFKDIDEEMEQRQYEHQLYRD